jgi:PKD repeat protein/DNA-binding PadR family transcriptional regulator
MGRAGEPGASRRRLRRAGVALLIAAPILLLGLGAASAHPAGASTPFSVQVVATPSTGSVPLTVTLTATVSSGTPETVAWSFGDGGSWSGSGVAALSVEHRYANVGTFTAVATVTETSGVVNGVASVGVVSGPLVAVIAASPSSGNAPLSVTFHALVSGGTGTYTAFLWKFGDGGVGAGPVVSYTYSHAGNFVAQLTVIDSSNDTAAASLSVSISAGAGAGSALSGMGSTILATAGIVGAGLTFGTYYGVRRRRQHRDELDDEEFGALPPGVFGPTSPSSASPRAGLAGASATTDESASSGMSSSAAEPATGGSPSAAPIASGLDAVTAPSPLLRTVRTRSARAPGEEPRRWSRDIVAYLGALPTLGPDDIATLDWTQKGMSDRLHTGQNQVSNVLRRLVSSGIVVERLEHVQGQPRRLKVYRLTLRGEALAREVRRRRPVSNPNLLRREW